MRLGSSSVRAAARILLQPNPPYPLQQQTLLFQNISANFYVTIVKCVTIFEVYRTNKDCLREG